MTAITSELERPAEFNGIKTLQKVSEDGRIITNKKGWLVRVLTLPLISLLIVLTIPGGIEHGDPFLLYSTIVPAHGVVMLFIGWFLYRNPVGGIIGNELVTVIIPAFNQREMIETVVNSIFMSKYPNLEVIAVNDGSRDGTREILDSLAKKYPNLKVIHKKNGGKRKAVASGFVCSKGQYFILLDSDSVIDRNAISEIMRVFKANPSVGGAVGHVKVWNANKNTLTKCQDAWYDFSFNVQKACESYFGSVTCCSGCLAGYRREAIENFIPYWSSSEFTSSDDRELTTFVIASEFGKRAIKEGITQKPISAKLMKSASKYDDAEDRMLTAMAMKAWKTVYVATAVVYTDVPEKFKGFIRQQERWKKGFIRTNFYVSSFFWHRRNPIMTILFYLDLISTFSAPVVLFTVVFYEPFVLKQSTYPIYILSSILLKGLATGFDYKFRDPSTRNWKYKPLMNIMTNFVISWLLLPALWNFRKNKWLTR